MAEEKMQVKALVDGEWKDITARARPIAWEVDVEGQGTGVLVADKPGEGTVVGDLTAQDLKRAWDAALCGSVVGHFEGETLRRVVAEEVRFSDGRTGLHVGGTIYNDMDSTDLVDLMERRHLVYRHDGDE